SRPPPRAKPWIAATTGLALSSSTSVLRRVGCGRGLPNWRMSAPAMKLPPAHARPERVDRRIVHRDDADSVLDFIPHHWGFAHKLCLLDSTISNRATALRRVPYWPGPVYPTDC